MGGEAVVQLADQRAQRTLRHRDAQTHKGEERLGEDSGRDAEHDLRDDGSDDVGQHFLEDDEEAAGAQRAGGQNELLILQLEHLRAGDAAHAHPFGQHQGKDDGHHAGLQHQQQQRDDDQPGDAVGHLQKALHHHIHSAAEVARDQAVAHADDHINDGRSHRDDQGDPGAFPCTGPDVAAVQIAAEPVVDVQLVFFLISVGHLGAGGGAHLLAAVQDAEALDARHTGSKVLLAQILAGVGIAVHARAKNGQQHDDDDQDQAQHGAPLAEKAEDGIANIALGLGKYIVDGGQTLRFSPRHPHNILQMSTMDFALRETQTRYYALDLKNLTEQFSVDDSFNLLRLNLKDADADGSLKFIVSTYDPYDQIIRDGYYPGGRKILSFVNILQHDVFPLADTLDQILHVGQDEMGRPIEIEFAVNIDPQNPSYATFYLLQVRPIVDNKEVMEEDLTLVEQADTILSSTSVLGHGVVTDVQDIIYVKTGAFCSSNNQSIAYDIEKMNRQFTAVEKNYVLVGPGRWGSSDSWLGIPVKWPHISNARVIVECGLENYRVDPSQGTHFFQNLTSFGVGYFTINPFKGDGWFDEEYLNSLPAVEETEYLRHVHFDKPIVIKMDGKKSLGVVLKPEK